jgi:outer membrane protein assembly factor BamD (BamD/ComL family)
MMIGLSAGCHSLGSMKKNLSAKTQEWLYSSYDDPKADAKQAEADRLFTEGKYSDARPVYRELANNNLNPKEMVERCRFQEAECYRCDRDYPKAVDTYHRMMMDHPAGIYRDKACEEIFKIADYWLDETRAEINAKKAGDSVTMLKLKRQMKLDRTYPNSDVEGRALLALDHISTDGVGGPNVDKALFWSGYVNFLRGNYDEADHYFSMLHQFHPNSSLRPIATEYAIMAKNNATGGAVYDGQKSAEALQMVHHAEATMPEFATDGKSDFLARQKHAIRAQQADKDLKTAQFYEQTDHPGSAFFYYEIVRRRYPGTKQSDMATARMKELKAKYEKGELQAASGNAFTDMRRTWQRWTGTKPVAEDK